MTSLCHLQRVFPDAVVVGGTASALYAGHRISFDHDHVLPDLRNRFDEVLTDLEAVAGWDYLDFAALASHQGFDAAVTALTNMDELYPQRNGDTWAVRTQLVRQLADPRPYDLDSVDLAEYKGIQPPLNLWANVAEICASLADRLTHAFMAQLAAETSPEADAARGTLQDWQAARERGETPIILPLPGLKT